VTDDLGINSDDVTYHGGLKHHSTIIVLQHFQVGVEELHQSGVHHTCTIMEISPIVRLDNVKNVVQWWHHDIGSNDFPLSNDSAVIILAWIAALSSIVL
jgi:hypothetical protein